MKDDPRSSTRPDPEQTAPSAEWNAQNDELVWSVVPGADARAAA